MHHRPALLLRLWLQMAVARSRWSAGGTCIPEHAQHTHTATRKKTAQMNVDQCTMHCDAMRCQVRAELATSGKQTRERTAD
jgi:hypothetical protein